MRLFALVENTASREDLGFEHGLSLFMETGGHKLLFDVGASDLFIQNAKKLDVDLREVEYLIISHGHYDHGGGLGSFLEMNEKAKVFVHPLAFSPHYAQGEGGSPVFAGLDPNLKHERQVVATGSRFGIAPGLELFVNTQTKMPRPTPNLGLLAEEDGEIVPDSFRHEQNLMVDEDGKTLLIVGCGHSGIVNILETYYGFKGRMPDYVVGGFHLSSRRTGDEDPMVLDKIAHYLKKTKAKYYTCHCTGIGPYQRLKKILGEQLSYLAAGDVID